MSYYSNIDYDDFFQTTATHLQRKLPAELRHFTTRRRSTDNWIVVEYPNIKYSQYELHLSHSSSKHAEYFGKGPHVVIAFYYQTVLGDSDAWLEALTPHVKIIEEQLYKRVVIGPWSENWVWIAESLDEEYLTPDDISCFFAQFIQATYRPITLAFQAISR